MGEAKKGRKRERDTERAERERASRFFFRRCITQTPGFFSFCDLNLSCMFGINPCVYLNNMSSSTLVCKLTSLGTEVSCIAGWLFFSRLKHAFSLSLCAFGRRLTCYEQLHTFENGLGIFKVMLGNISICFESFRDLESPKQTQVFQRASKWKYSTMFFSLQLTLIVLTLLHHCCPGV